MLISNRLGATRLLGNAGQRSRPITLSGNLGLVLRTPRGLPCNRLDRASASCGCGLLSLGLAPRAKSSAPPRRLPLLPARFGDFAKYRGRVMPSLLRKGVRRWFGFVVNPAHVSSLPLPISVGFRGSVFVPMLRNPPPVANCIPQSAGPAIVSGDGLAARAAPGPAGRLPPAPCPFAWRYGPFRVRVTSWWLSAAGSWPSSPLGDIA